jgi:SHS2 domain-containing protein
MDRYMTDFRIIEEGAFGDYEFEAEADTKEEIFGICGKALFEAVTDTAKISTTQKNEFEVFADNDIDLLYAFLAELIYIKDTENVFLAKFELTFREGSGLTCIAYGEPIDRQRHVLKTDVKAVTYHNFVFERTAAGYRARVILDL